MLRGRERAAAGRRLRATARFERRTGLEVVERDPLRTPNVIGPALNLATAPLAARTQVNAARDFEPHSTRNQGVGDVRPQQDHRDEGERGSGRRTGPRSSPPTRSSAAAPRGDRSWRHGQEACPPAGRHRRSGNAPRLGPATTRRARFHGARPARGVAACGAQARARCSQHAARDRPHGRSCGGPREPPYT